MVSRFFSYATISWFLRVLVFLVSHSEDAVWDLGPSQSAKYFSIMVLIVKCRHQRWGARKSMCPCIYLRRQESTKPTGLSADVFLLVLYLSEADFASQIRRFTCFYIHVRAASGTGKALSPRKLEPYYLDPFLTHISPLTPYKGQGLQLGMQYCPIHQIVFQERFSAQSCLHFCSNRGL